LTGNSEVAYTPCKKFNLKQKSPNTTGQLIHSPIIKQQFTEILQSLPYHNIIHIKTPIKDPIPK